MISRLETDRRQAAEVTGAYERPSVASLASIAKNRGRLDIVAEIVNTCRNGASKSRIMLSANVNSVMATQLIERLVSCGLLSSNLEDNRMIAYVATPEGSDFVKRYTELTSMLCPSLVPTTKMNDPHNFDSLWV